MSIHDPASSPILSLAPPRRRWDRWARRTSILILTLVVIILLIPSPIHPVAWEPPVAPTRVGVLAPNTALDHATLRGQGVFESPEDIAIDRAGTIYTGTADGTIWAITRPPDGTPTFTRLATTGGGRLACVSPPTEPCLLPIASVACSRLAQPGW